MIRLNLLRRNLLPQRLAKALYCARRAERYYRAAERMQEGAALWSIAGEEEKADQLAVFAAAAIAHAQRWTERAKEEAES